MTEYDKQLITEVGKEFLTDFILIDDDVKEHFTFMEHYEIYNNIENLDYEGVVSFFCEDVREFEGKFSKFLKYGFAAIAGATLGLMGSGLKAGVLGGPPLGMFAFYIFRKLKDPCERQCYRKLPLTTKRQICLAKCQVDASRRVVQDLRSEIGKCRQFLKPKKCEKKLLKDSEVAIRKVMDALDKMKMF